MGHTFNGSEAGICDWSDDCNSMFSCRATTKPFNDLRKEESKMLLKLCYILY